jgi:hypothetical protein
MHPNEYVATAYGVATYPVERSCAKHCRVRNSTADPSTSPRRKPPCEALLRMTFPFIKCLHEANLSIRLGESASGREKQIPCGDDNQGQRRPRATTKAKSKYTKCSGDRAHFTATPKRASPSEKRMTTAVRTSGRVANSRKARLRSMSSAMSRPPGRSASQAASNSKRMCS